MSEITRTTGRELRSEITKAGELRIVLDRQSIPEPTADEVVVRIEAAPINPSDLTVLLGPADLSTLRVGGTADQPSLHARIAEEKLPSVRTRLNVPLAIGNEGAGIVIGAGANASHLVNKRVAIFGVSTFAEYRVAKAAECLVLPEGTTSAQGAGSFVNPLTALGMIETMGLEGHSALVHTAAASNLGQILLRLCRDARIPLVNIVRAEAQATLLRDLGATHVCCTNAPTFVADLAEAITETGATLAFDAVGGGYLAGDILACMEAAITRAEKGYNRYGSTRHKQVYLYGTLDNAPTVIDRRFGLAWGIGGWLMPRFLERIGPQATKRLHERVMSELTTTFATRYTSSISLEESLKPEIVRAYARRATGEKYLLMPNEPSN